MIDKLIIIYIFLMLINIGTATFDLINGNYENKSGLIMLLFTIILIAPFAIAKRFDLYFQNTLFTVAVAVYGILLIVTTVRDKELGVHWMILMFANIYYSQIMIEFEEIRTIILMFQILASLITFIALLKHEKKCKQLKNAIIK